MKLLALVTASLLGAGLVAEAEAGWSESLSDAGVELHGFVDYRLGRRIRNDPVERDMALNELRAQVDGMWYHNLFTAQLKADLVYDELVEDRNTIHLDAGTGWFDLRQAHLQASPLPWLDVKLGRQVLTWGTGDLVFINDLFPKDWQSFFLGRADEYLKAPSDALMVSLFPGIASIDIVYTPRFDADRYITGERISYWNGRAIVGNNDILETDLPDDSFDDDEMALRIYGYLFGYELAVYGYYGFWKSPGGLDPATGAWRFPELGVYGASVRGPLGSGIANLEAGYYDSAEDGDGDDPFINNGEVRLLAGYEREAFKNVTVGVQYYLERMLDYDAYRQALDAAALPTDTARDEDRHTVTLRVTWLLMNQNLTLSCFARYGISDTDLYIKPSAAYNISDHWRASVGGNLFVGQDPYTFLGQFKNNSNLHASVRYSF